MRRRTGPNTITQTLTTAAYEILGPNPKRKSFLLSPVAGGNVVAAPVVAVVFAQGNAQPWSVPTGVTQVVTAYVWAPGGNGGPSLVGDGGGGGGGGAFAASGPVPATPATTWSINVGAGGSGNLSNITNNVGTIVAQAHAGATAATSASAAGGIADAGPVRFSGGAGGSATGALSFGGGGGGSAGTYQIGGAGAGQTKGVAGGGATVLGYGLGAAGGDGGDDGLDGNNGSIPGGGGGGAGNAAAIVGVGADGLAVIFYVPAQGTEYISLSHRQDVVAGRGVLNFITGQTFPIVITDNEIGDAVGMPWWIVSSITGVTVQIVEFLYEEDCDE